MSAVLAAIGTAAVIASAAGLASGLWLHIIREDRRRTARSRP